MKSPVIKAAGLTDIGLSRTRNEDTFSIDEALGLYIVADGMGGHSAGDMASKIAVDLIHRSFGEWTSAQTGLEDLFGYPDSTLSRTGNYLLSGIRLANRVIHEMAAEFEEYQGMGTTVAALAAAPGLLVAANAGDSTIFRVRDGEIERLSKEHTIVAEQVEMGIMTTDEARRSPMKHMLTLNLGSARELLPNISEIEPLRNDRLVLCSDGLTDLVSEDEILSMVKGEEDPESLCRQFVDTALKRGGHDNTTVISIHVREP